MPGPVPATHVSEGTELTWLASELTLPFHKIITTSLLAAVLATAVTAAGAARASAARSSPGRYVGHTAQGIRVVLRVTGPGQSRNPGSATFRYRARLECSDGSTFLDRYFTDTVVVHHERFADRYSADRGAVLTWVAGRLQRRRARGTIRIVERYGEVPDAHGNTPLDPAGAIVCDSGTIRWRGTRSN